MGGISEFASEIQPAEAREGLEGSCSSCKGTTRVPPVNTIR